MIFIPLGKKKYMVLRTKRKIENAYLKISS